MIGTTVSFWEYDRKGEMTKFVGKVEAVFTDPEERYARPSCTVRMADGSCQTPYVDECREEGGMHARLVDDLHRTDWPGEAQLYGLDAARDWEYEAARFQYERSNG